MKPDFASRLTEATRLYGPLCVGIDPHPGMVPDLFGGDTPRGIQDWAQSVIEVAAGKVAAIKPQAGLFERHGAAGFAALQTVILSARAAGLIVLMDAKRGDIGSTAEGYAQAYLAPGSPLESDALTVNPYMGLDTLEPYARIAEETGKGVVVLVRTSNPGAADFQLRDMGGAPLYAQVTQALQPLTEQLMSPCGWSNLMMVIGATGPEEARSVRAMAPKALFLIPGYGAQGAGAAEACAGLVNGEGGLVNASRSVTFPKAAMTAPDRASWAREIEAALIHARDELSAASAG